MSKLLQINLRIDSEIREWLDSQPRSMNISELVRSQLHAYMAKQVDKNDTIKE